MVGQARFTYTDRDMVATQRAGWTWCARWRNLLISFAVISLFEGAILAGLNLWSGTRGAASDPFFVAAASAGLTILIFGLLAVTARGHARQVLRNRRPISKAWSAAGLHGEQIWTWDRDRLRMEGEAQRTELPWAVVSAWLEAANVLLFFPRGGQAFSIQEDGLSAGWRTAPKLLLFPFGGYVLALPKRALAPGETSDLVAVLRAAGLAERRPFGFKAARRAAPP